MGLGLTCDLLDNVQTGEVVEGSSSKDTVAVVQSLDVHHTEVQQLWRGQRSAGDLVQGCVCQR